MAIRWQRCRPCATTPGRFAAVITDAVMPGLSGTGLRQALRAFALHLPVLLVSGYGGALLAQRGVAGAAASMSIATRRQPLDTCAAPEPAVVIALPHRPSPT
jgi:DNA-binding NtrC family response regulator